VYASPPTISFNGEGEMPTDNIIGLLKDVNNIIRSQAQEWVIYQSLKEPTKTTSHSSDVLSLHY
jgi:hypothetical protein